MSQIHGDQNYPCEYCRQSFENNNMIRAHIESTHERDNMTLLQRSVQQGEVPDGSTGNIKEIE